MKTSNPKCTNMQKGCVHLWLRKLSEALNDSGQGMRACFEAGKLTLEVSWTEDTIKQVFWEGYFNKMYPSIDGMPNLTTEQVNIIVKDIDRAMLDVFGINVPFPSEEELKNERSKST